MKDFFEQYRKTTFKKNATIAFSALVLALGVNAFLFGTPTGVQLQTSAIQYAGGAHTETGADITMISAGTGTDLLKLHVSKPLTNVKEIRATVLFDAKGLKVRDVFTTDNSADIIKLSNIDGVMLVYVRYKQPKDIPAGSDVATFAATKTGTGRSVVNLAETQFVSGKDTYELSNQAIEF